MIHFRPKSNLQLRQDDTSDTADRFMGNDNFRGNQQMKAGLLSLQYARQSTQKGNDGFIELHRFTPPTREPIETIGDKVFSKICQRRVLRISETRPPRDLYFPCLQVLRSLGNFF